MDDVKESVLAKALEQREESTFKCSKSRLSFETE